MHQNLEGSFLREQIIEIVENLYDIGTVTEVQEIFGGFTNRSFRIQVLREGCKKTYLARKYKENRAVEEVLFEHAIINYTIQNGLTIGAGIVKNRQGSTYVQPPNINCIFAIYEYLKGEDKYTWNTHDLSDTEYQNAARVLAVFHNAVRNFDPMGLQRKEPPILKLWPTFPEKFRKLAKQNRPGKLVPYFREQLPSILDIITINPFGMAEAAAMLVIPTHYDYHPGNLKWAGEEVVGVFDFDWTKIDLRLFDLCMALIYFCSSWVGNCNGELRLGRCGIFLRSYQHRLKELNGLESVSPAEREAFPKMLAIANIYLLYWGVSTFLEREEACDDEYQTYLKHSVRLMRWISTHSSIIAETMANAL
ncbi:MAG TPA: homoserine kinase [Desulfobacterales bacterium]|nr:homoserine kinase [Desulfobacterales bacterium]